VQPQPASVPQDEPLLIVKGLQTHFFTPSGVVKAVEGVDFTVRRGEVFGLVGESGCGKSVTARSIMRLVDHPGKIVAGDIRFNGQSVLELTERQMTQIRGRRISMIFQEPQSSLNPVFSIGSQVGEVLQVHGIEGWEQINQRTLELLKLVGIPDPEVRAADYPHQISGGQAQRVMIASALAFDPQLLIADEPTTALDVTIQAQILDLIRGLAGRFGTAVILITHDLGVIAEMANRVAVMYAGHIVEQADVGPLYNRPLHPYTQGLMASIPVLGEDKETLTVIPGVVPDPINLPPACRFSPRCTAKKTYSLSICDQKEPDLIPANGKHLVRCWLYQDHLDHRAPLEV
jgi:oligopeptide/dipeptide ABC transporter ATP-binding protein